MSDREWWNRVKQVLQGALERDGHEREAYLRHMCGGDPVLLSEVQSLLAAHERAGSFAELPAVSALTESAVAAVGRISEQEGVALTRGDLLGPYEITQFLGNGGMGRVYRARDTRLDRDVAIKFLRNEFLRNPERLGGLIDEARAASALNHPNILTVHEIGEVEGTPFIAMEFVDGDTLRQRLRAGPPPVGDALDMMLQVGEALEAAHARGIVHGDIKPENVMIRRDGYIKLLDFGLATVPREIDERGRLVPGTPTAVSVAGTPGYASPEQLEGRPVDQRSDIFSFGVLLCELVTGTNPLGQPTLLEMANPIAQTPAPGKPPIASLPKEVAVIVATAIEKNPDQRYQTIAELVGDLRSARSQADPSSHPSRATPPMAQARRGLAWAFRLALVGVIVFGALIWLRMRTTSTPKVPNYLQITDFPDSVTSPALSPDGRMVTFIRGPRTFYGPGEVYVKQLPDGQPVQLTRDGLSKMSPVFSPDSSTIAYTVVTAKFGWETWVVPARGGDPKRWLTNASGLSWLDAHRLLYSEITKGTHMRIVASEEGRAERRVVYAPNRDEGMAHRSYRSPDGKWVLVAEMTDGVWGPCRIVPLDGASIGSAVGPRGSCTFAAWSPDGQWMYFSSNAGGAYHVWRQLFPNGPPRQITFGPTEEEGIVLFPDGRSLVTAVGIRQSAVWVHDPRNERAVSIEGYAFLPSGPRVHPQVFSPDGSKLFYLVRRGSGRITLSNEFAGEVWMSDVETSRSGPVLPGFAVIDYDVSPDGQRIVFAALDEKGRSHIHLGWLDRRTPPRQVSPVEADSPRFDPKNDQNLYCRMIEGASNYIYRMRTDGAQVEKAVSNPVTNFFGVSPDGAWFVGHVPAVGADTTPIFALPTAAGQSPRLVCTNCESAAWSPGGKYFVVTVGASGPGRTFVISLPAGEALPNVPPDGFRSQADLSWLPSVALVRDGYLSPGRDPSVYAYTRPTIQRNLHRVSLP